MFALFGSFVLSIGVSSPAGQSEFGYAVSAVSKVEIDMVFLEEVGRYFTFNSTNNKLPK
jgi:hypothetical protein